MSAMTTRGTIEPGPFINKFYLNKNGRHYVGFLMSSIINAYDTLGGPFDINYIFTELERAIYQEQPDPKTLLYKYDISYYVDDLGCELDDYYVENNITIRANHVDFTPTLKPMPTKPLTHPSLRQAMEYIRTQEAFRTYPFLDTMRAQTMDNFLNGPEYLG